MPRPRPSDLILGALPLVLVACGGAAPVHSGYPETEKEPWKSATKVRLKDNGEGTVEGAVNFANRERAKWYFVELPAPGVLNAKLKMDPRTTGADVGFEVLDAGFNIVVPATDDNDIGQDDKVRNVKDARAGRYYYHVFTLKRTDVADFRLRLRYDPLLPTARVPIVSDEPAEPRSGFPWTVPNVPVLPQVAASDDTPRGKVTTKVTEDPKPVVEKDPMDGATVSASISERKKEGQSVRIIINKGSAHGVDVGWLGSVVDKNGKSVPKGMFKVKSVKNDESEGVVGLTLDELQANPRVKLKPPQ